MGAHFTLRAPAISARKTTEEKCDPNHFWACAVTQALSPRGSDKAAGVMATRPTTTRTFDSFGCTLIEGLVSCTGNNDWGQLGDGTTRSAYGADRRSPKDLPRSIALAVGRRHACALGEDRRIRCWGSARGFPGGFEFPHATDKFVAVGSDYGSSSNHQWCALSQTSDVWCHTFPTGTLVRGLAAPIAELAGDASRVCARLTSGKVACWWGEAQPELIPGLDDATALHNGVPCAVRASGGAVCWWQDIVGDQLQQVVEDVGLTEIVALRPGVAATESARPSVCALRANGEVWCWGIVGLRRWHNSTPPHPGPTDWQPGWRIDELFERRWQRIAGGQAIAALGSGGCVLRKDGTMALLRTRWAGVRGSLAIDAPSPPLRVARLVPGTGCYGERADGSIATLMDSTSPTWDMSPYTSGAVVVKETAIRGARELASSWFACAWLSDGTVKCDIAGDQSFAEAIVFDQHVGKLDVDGARVCALLASGGVRCVTFDTYKKVKGPLEDPLSVSSPVPLVITLPSH
jgi:hypothetical protein